MGRRTRAGWSRGHRLSHHDRRNVREDVRLFAVRLRSAGRSVARSRSRRLLRGDRARRRRHSDRHGVSRRHERRVRDRPRLRDDRWQVSSRRAFPGWRRHALGPDAGGRLGRPGHGLFARPLGNGLFDRSRIYARTGIRTGRAADSRSRRELLRRYDLRWGARVGYLLSDGPGRSRDHPARLRGLRNPQPRIPDSRRRRQLLRGHVLPRPAPGHFRQRHVDPRFLRSLHLDKSGDTGLGLRALRNEQPRRRL